MWLFLALVSAAVVGPHLVVAQNCNYQTTVVAGTTYAFWSPNYNNYYPSGQECSYTYYAQPGYKLVLNCPLVEIPCAYNDKLLVNLYGYAGAAETSYCGTGTINNLKTTANGLIVRLSTKSSAGRFYCQVSSEEDPCQCGRRKSARIVGGSNAMVHEFPAQAMLTDNSNNLVCGAALIHSQYALTAAHCVKSRSTSNTKLLVGEHDRSTSADTSFTQQYNINSIIVHSSYDASTGLNDIAMVRTTSQIAFNEAVGVVCLPYVFGSNAFTGNVVTAAGWGSTDFGAPASAVLKKVDLNVITNTQCAGSYSYASNFNFMCTYTPNKDTCQYDSGTNLFLTYNRLYTVGVTSGGSGCASSKPTLNTRVSQYLDWIGQNAPGATFCAI